MSYVSVTKISLTAKWADLSEDQRMAEQVAALETVAKHGGEMQGIWALPAEGTALAIATYPDERSSAKAVAALNNRGTYDLLSQRAWPLDEWLQLSSEATADS